MQNLCTGDSNRFKIETWPDVILYFKSDFYLPHTYLDNEVIKKHTEVGKHASNKRWDKSPHV